MPLVLWAGLLPVWQGRQWAGGFTYRDVARKSCLCSSRSDPGRPALCTSGHVAKSHERLRVLQGAHRWASGRGHRSRGARSPAWAPEPGGQEPREGTGAQCGDRCLASPLSELKPRPVGSRPCLQALVGPGQGALGGVPGQGESACAGLRGCGLSVLCPLVCPALQVQT